MITDIKLVREKHVEVFEKTVNKLLKEKWVPYCTPFVFENHIILMMVRENERETSLGT